MKSIVSAIALSIVASTSFAGDLHNALGKLNSTAGKAANNFGVLQSFNDSYLQLSSYVQSWEAGELIQAVGHVELVETNVDGVLQYELQAAGEDYLSVQDILDQVDVYTEEVTATLELGLESKVKDISVNIAEANDMLLTGTTSASEYLESQDSWNLRLAVMKLNGGLYFADAFSTGVSEFSDMFIVEEVEDDIVSEDYIEPIALVAEDNAYVVEAVQVVE